MLSFLQSGAAAADLLTLVEVGAPIAVVGVILGRVLKGIFGILGILIVALFALLILQHVMYPDEPTAVPVWFGQRRINASGELDDGNSYTLAGNRDEIAGGAQPFVIPVFLDAGHGVYVALGNRRLAAYSLAGAVTAPVCLAVPTASDLERLNDPRGLGPDQTSLPSPVIRVTASRRDDTLDPDYPLITSTVMVEPAAVPPCAPG